MNNNDAERDARARGAYRAGYSGVGPDGTKVDPLYADALPTHRERIAFWQGEADATRDFENEVEHNVLGWFKGPDGAYRRREANELAWDYHYEEMRDE